MIKILNILKIKEYFYWFLIGTFLSGQLFLFFENKEAKQQIKQTKQYLAKCENEKNNLLIINKKLIAEIENCKFEKDIKIKKEKLLKELNNGKNDKSSTIPMDSGSLIIDIP